MKVGLLVLPGSHPSRLHCHKWPFHRCGALYREGVKDGIHLPVLDEGVACLIVLRWVFPLYFKLLGLLRIADELSEISLINQFLEVSTEGPTFDGGMTHPVMKGAVIPRSGSLRVLQERSSRAPDPMLVFDGVKHIVDRNLEWN